MFTLLCLYGVARTVVDVATLAGDSSDEDKGRAACRLGTKVLARVLLPGFAELMPVDEFLADNVDARVNMS